VRLTPSAKKEPTDFIGLVGRNAKIRRIPLEYAENLEAYITGPDDELLVIVVDLSTPIGLSKSGKSTNIGTSRGNAGVVEGVAFNCTVWEKIRKRKGAGEED